MKDKKSEIMLKLNGKMTGRELVNVIASFFKKKSNIFVFTIKVYLCNLGVVFYSPMFPFFLDMGSLDMGFFRSLSIEQMLIKIWDCSNHAHNFIPIDSESCHCRHFFNLCIKAAREQWIGNFIYFDTAIYWFQFHRKELVDIMSIDNPVLLEHYIRCFIINV